jgi:hypothetical protein
MDPSKVTVKMLNGTEVFCQHDGCENVAVFLFSAATTKPFCAVRCTEHALELACRLQINPPPRKISRTQPWLKASA